MAYQVGIDLGTSSVVAAVRRPDGTAHVVPSEGGAGAAASAVYLGADGTLLVGDAAERRALSDPGRVVRELTRRVGDATPLLVGREPVGAAELAARVLARLVDDVARREGGVATRVAVTHPGAWGPHRVGSLRAALAEQGLGSAVLVPEPVAAAAAYAATAHVAPGATVGLHDLGGGRFEASVVRSGPGGLELAATSEEIERSGGAELDEVVFAHVRTALGAAWDALDPTDPEVLAAVADLRRACTAAKEALSRDTEVLVPVAVPGVRTQVRLGRAEFEEAIRPTVAETVEAMRRAMDVAGTTPAELAALVLVGGSARVPLVPQLLGEAFGREVTVVADPVAAVAVGAALLAGAAGGRRVGPAGPTRSDGGRAAAGSGANAALGTSDVPNAPFAPPAAAGASGAGGGTEVLAVARPPKQARPFTAGSGGAPSRPRRIALLASAAALGLALLGGVVAFGAGRLGAGTEAGAQTPVPVVDAGVPASVAGSATAPPPGSSAAPGAPARVGPPPPSPRARQAPPPAPTTSAPPAGRAPTGSAPPDEPAESTPAPPPAPTGGGAGDGGADDGGAGDGGAGDGEGNGGGNDGGNDEGGGSGAGTGADAEVGGTGAGGGAPPAAAPANGAAGGRAAREDPADG